ncbi:hypothetical protein ARMSODRAFT_981599 [Armillaria solidipes]|uniref:MYND-type domain-containing protein n=1 Tax=Armillaria solidipes TaxID=1076256 RepID=A0A2H3AR54_9AGAR|nr:hypothetical protein ARMSODRAFT_981599 [Armillaria solidipes]
MEKLIASTVSHLDRTFHIDSFVQKSAKGGSYEAMMALAVQASKSQRAHRAFFCVMEENLKFNTASIQDMERGRLPVVPSLDPKDVVNLSCNSMLALTTGLRSQVLLQPVCLEESTSSMVSLIPAMSFWLCLFCEHIILPSRTSEFTFIDFHHAVVFILAWTTSENKITMETKLFTDYLPFLWFHLPLAVRNTISMMPLLACESIPLRNILVRQLEENSTLSASLIIQFIVDEFSHIPEESDTPLPYKTFLTVTSTFQLSAYSPPIHTALLKNNSIQWISLILRFVTRRTRFTYIALHLAMDCVCWCLLYILRVMRDGHSFIHQLLGYDILLYLLKASHSLHAHPELIDQKVKGLKTAVENHTVKILHMVISHFAYASILKRSKKAISKIRRQHVDEFLKSKDPGLLVCLVVTERCQFTLYCSRTCQKDDWSRSSTGHRSVCTQIKQLRTDANPSPMSFSDYMALKILNSQYVDYHRQQPSEWKELLDEYIAENGGPDPLWPLVLKLDYRAINVEPDVYIDSSERCVEDLEILAEAREGAGTLVYCIIPDGKRTVEKYLDFQLAQYTEYIHIIVIVAKRKPLKTSQAAFTKCGTDGNTGLRGNWQFGERPKYAKDVKRESRHSLVDRRNIHNYGGGEVVVVRVMEASRRCADLPATSSRWLPVCGPTAAIPRNAKPSVAEQDWATFSSDTYYLSLPDTPLLPSLKQLNPMPQATLRHKPIHSAAIPHHHSPLIDRPRHGHFFHSEIFIRTKTHTTMHE